MDAVPPFGPIYPALPSVAKYRRMAVAAGSVAAMDRSLRQAYGAAVEQAIRALQRADMSKVYTTPSPRCASGSWANTAEGIEAAVRAKQAREAAAAKMPERRYLTDWKYTNEGAWS